MLYRLLKSEEPEKKLQKPTLGEFLIAKIQKEYLNIPFYKKKYLRIGREGIERANYYLNYLGKADSTEWLLFDEVLLDLKQSYGEGKLSTSKNLRVILAEGLCEYMGISKKNLNQKTSQKLSIFPGANVGVTYDLLKVNTAIELIREKRRQMIDLSLDKPSVNKP